MINLSKTRLMTKCAVYEKGRGAEDIRLSAYYKADYVRLGIVRNVLSISIGYVLVLALILFYELGFNVDNIFELDYVKLGRQAVAVYLILLTVYVIFSFIYYSAAYTKSRARIGRYFSMLGRINKLNEADEQIKELEDR